MIKLLAIDTSADALSVALKCGDQMFFHHQIQPREHAKELLNVIDTLLGQASCTLNELNCIAVGRGPGTFVGVRIGVSVAQGLALSNHIPVAPISTLTALARQAFSQTGAPSVVVAMDARMNEVYWAHFKQEDNGKIVTLVDETLSSPDKMQPQVEEGCVGFGTGWSAYESTLNENPALNKVIRVVQKDCYPHAKDIAILGEEAFQKGFCVRAEQLMPVYLRDTVAWLPAPPLV